ncbi:MAG TPA: cyclic pyranopterin monophosphate synthase MoaC [Vicinamibacterales bacterium]
MSDQRRKPAGGSRRLSHVDAAGRIRMVDVGHKAATPREAVARGHIHMSAEALRQVRTGTNKKGDPLQTARLAGIMAAKQTAALIPLCHPIALTHADVQLIPVRDGYTIEATARTVGPTGVEMEALTAVAVAALTIYDMVKAVDREMVIGDVRLITKTK